MAPVSTCLGVLVTSGLGKVSVACPEVKFQGGSGAKRFPSSFSEQPGSFNGRPIWVTPDGYYLYHKLTSGITGDGRWIVSNAVGLSHGHALLDSWAVSPLDAPLVSPSSSWHIHDGTEWLREGDTQVICAEGSGRDASFWLEFKDLPQLTGTYVQTGSVWQGGRRVYERRPSWPPDALPTFLYWLQMSGAKGRWLLAPVVGDSERIWAFCDGEEMSPIELFQQSKPLWHVFKEGKWVQVAPDAVHGSSQDERWWEALQKHRNQHFADMSGLQLLNLSNGVRMPSVGCGTDGLDGEGIERALTAGARLLDTAMVYQHEADLAAALKSNRQNSRQRIFIVSKVWHTQLGFNATLAAVEQHLRKLGTSYLDLVLVHWPKCYPQLEWMGCDDSLTSEGLQPEDVGTWQQTWRALERLYAEGQIRSIGVSNFDYNLLWEALVQQHPRVQPHVIQNWFDPLRTDDGVRTLASNHGVQFMGYSPLRHTFQSVEEKTGASDMSSDAFQEAYAEVHRVTVRIAGEVARSPAQVLLRWMLHLGIAIIPRSSTLAHLTDNLDMFGWELQPDHVRTLTSLVWNRAAEL